MKTRPFPTALLLPFAAALAAPGSARAAETVQMEKIEVTAQHRPQDILTVPLAITAYSGAFLEQAGISSYRELAPLVPGFVAQEQSANNPSFNLRGITSDDLDPRAPARVSVFQDGVSISRSAASVVELHDMQRVEVIKGPQGTLFGRSAEIGALSLIQNKARNAVERSLTFGGGNEGQRLARAVVNAPLSAQVFGRVAFSYAERDGAIANLVDGSDLNGKDTAAARASLRWQPTASTTADLILNWQRDTPPGTAFKSGTFPPPGGDLSPFTAAALTRGAALGLDRTVAGATAIVTHQINPAWTLTATTGWRSHDAYERFDGDGSALYLIELDDDSTGHQFSQDVRLNFDAGRGFAGFLGAGFFREKAEQRIQLQTDERQFWPFLSGQFRDGLIAAGVPAALAGFAVPTLSPVAPAATLPPTFAAFNNPLLPAQLRGLAALAGAPLRPFHTEGFINSGETSAVDLFADGTWRVADKLELTAGARVTFERVTSGYEVVNSPVPGNVGFILGAFPNNAFLPTGGRRSADSDHTGVAARLAARYEFSRTLGGYASIARGRRPEALVVDAATVTPLREEVVWNYEAGLKGTLAGNRLAWNAALFRYDYAHFQSVTSDPRSPGRFITIDAGNATGTGGEFAAQAAVDARTSIFVTYGYTDATFDATGDNGQPQRYAGNMLRLSSRHTFALGGTLKLPVADGQLALTPVWQYRSRHYFDDDNARFGGRLQQAGFGLFNLRAAWRAKDTWEVAVAAENLADKNHLVDAGNTGSLYGIPTYVAGTPRLISASVTLRW